MKKEIITHFLFLASFLIFVALVRHWLKLDAWTFWIGGLFGTILPDADHLIYIYFLRPYELTSQRAVSLIKQKSFFKALELIYDTRYEKTKLIFHTAYFQIIFLVLTFLVVTSSGSYFGTGLVLAFGLHLLVDQAVDLAERGDLSPWFRETPYISPEWFTKERTIFYWAGMIIVLLLFAFFL